MLYLRNKIQKFGLDQLLNNIIKKITYHWLLNWSFNKFK